MLKRKSICYVLIGRDKIWIIFKKQLVHEEYCSEPLASGKVVQECAQWPCYKIVLFLDPPWILQTFQTIIPLSQKDALQYSRNILGFHHIHPEKFSKIGICFFELLEKKKKGLFTASLPMQTIQLIEELRKKLHVKVEPVPLFYACLLEILNDPSDAVFFHGFSQSALIYKQKARLQQITLLSESLSNESNQKIAEDFLKIAPQNTHPIDLDESFACSMLGQWHKVKPKIRFEWETKRIAWQGNWKLVALLGWLGLMMVAFYGYFTIQEQNQRHQQQINQGRQQLQEGQVEIERFKIYTTQRERFIQRNTIYQHLKHSSRMAQNVLTQVIAPMNQQVWIEQLNYEGLQLHLRLLTLKTVLVPKVLDELARMTLVEKVILKSQEMVKLNQHNVVKFDIQIDLKIEDVESTQNLNLDQPNE